MRIRTQFIITMLLFGIILVFMAASAIITKQQMDTAREQEWIAANIAQGASELSYLANDYLIYRESQQLNRWHSKFASFSKQVASLDMANPEQQVLVRNIQVNQQRLKEVFDSTSSAVGGLSGNHKAGLDPALLQISWSRIAIQSQGLISDASRLSQLLHQQMDHLTKRNTLLIYIMTGLFGALLLASYMLTYQRILKSLAKLQTGTASVGSGNFDYKLEEEKNDEMADLSRAFNRMTADLKTVTASKADLEHEIAERKKAEEALRDAHERAVWLARFPEQNPDPILRASADGTVLYCNPASARLSDWKCEVGGVLPKDLLPLVGRAMVEGKELHQDVRLDERLYIVWISPFHEEGYANVYASDITERMQAEEALRQSEERYRTLFEAMTEGFALHEIICDERGQPCDYRFLEINSAFERLTGLKRATLLGRRVREALPGTEAHWIENYGKVALTGEPVHFENFSAALDRWYEVFAYRPAAGRFAVLFTDITARKRTGEALRKAHDELEMRVQERTSELTETVQRLQVEMVQRKRLEETLRESENKVRFFASQCLTAQETERKRIAGELHDSIAASLAATKFRIERIAQDMRQGRGGPGTLTDLALELTGIINEVRRIMADLRPSILDDLGILAAMSWFCREFQKTYSQISVAKQIEMEEHEVPDSLKTPIFRISQEAMNNIAKHSRASLVNLSLRKEDDKILLTLQDNGQGFDPDTARKGMGLSSIRERAELSGGSSELKSAIGKGTIIRVSWPI